MLSGHRDNLGAKIEVAHQVVPAFVKCFYPFRLHEINRHKGQFWKHPVIGALFQDFYFYIHMQTESISDFSCIFF
jgi:hypothetical protein